jgi:hypothetical protein
MKNIEHTYNPSYSGGRAQDDHGSGPGKKKFVRTHLNQEKLIFIVCTCYPSYVGNVNRRIAVQVCPEHTCKNLFKIN